MTIKKFISLLFLLCISSLALQAEIITEPLDNTLPSQQTGQELTELTTPSPSLRQAPGSAGGPNWAQKEIPLSDTDLSVLLFMMLLTSGYAYKKFKTSNRS